MLPKIEVSIDGGLPLVELQQAVDSDLKTENKKVAGAINELYEDSKTSGQAIEGFKSDLTALQKTVDEKADSANIYTKTEVDSKCIKTNDILLTSNFHASSKRFYISKLDNAWYALHKRYTVSAKIYRKSDDKLIHTLTESEIGTFFNGSYDGSYQMSAGNYIVITIEAPVTVIYPYGYYIISFYTGALPVSVKARLYSRCNKKEYTWRDFPCSITMNNSNGTVGVYQFSNIGHVYYTKKWEFTIIGSDDHRCLITEIEHYNTRDNYFPMVAKCSPQTLYYPLTGPEFIGDLTGTATKATADADGNNIPDTYLKKADLAAEVNALLQQYGLIDTDKTNSDA